MSDLNGEVEGSTFEYIEKNKTNLKWSATFIINNSKGV